MFVEIKQKMEVALKVHSSEKVDGLKKKFKKNVAQVNKKRSDQSSRIRNLRHVLSTYESGVNLKINEEVLFNIK